MAKLVNDKLILTIEEKDLIKHINEFELIPNSDGIYLLIDKNIAENKKHITCSIEENFVSTDPLEKEKQEILTKIKNGKMCELVEGKLEEKFNEQSKQALSELIKDELIFVFKLNKNYKKGIYKLKEQKNILTPKESEIFGSKKLNPDYTLEKDGFIATTNTGRAKILSNEFKEQIEKRELKGIKTFEGIYYLIQTVLLEKYTIKLMNLFEKQNKATMQEIINELKVSNDLIKIVCEFLKEDGELIERKKDEYQYIN